MIEAYRTHVEDNDVAPAHLGNRRRDEVDQKIWSVKKSPRVRADSQLNRIPRRNLSCMKNEQEYRAEKAPSTVCYGAGCEFSHSFEPLLAQESECGPCSQ
ncbi:hypothetical protein MJC1_01483 [Methylocystis sp. MJC1]|uniref:hypothetical protein n=1 Tax=Methylocystis sp. MJC1 TaxID=2654282 RepID=UPI001C1E40CC|nr:hypothetical protein [Methylocystis sp. MJC1]KAF2991495.1 hypothetical protein MJC1_01483 [Methylocystis sp. MJC1]